LLGPIITGASTGNAYQAGLSYGTSQFVKKTTGKSSIENIIKVLNPKSKDNEFQRLVKKRIKETRKKLNLTN